MCTDNDLIIGYVYGEIGDTDRAAFESHLTTCAACRYEVSELRAARGHLTAWAPPEPDLGFEIVRATPRLASTSDRTNPAPERRFRVSPAWGLAAAAVLVLATAAAIANIEIRYDAQGLVVRTGWARDAAAPPAAVQANGGRADLVPVSRAELDALNRRLKDLEAAASRPSSATVLASGPRMSDAEIIRRMQEMLNRSEARQQRELATQITQVIRDVDTVRQIDNVRYRQGIGQLGRQTAAEVANQFNMYLSRVSQQK